LMSCASFSARQNFIITSQANVCQVSHLTRYAVSIHIFRLN
jgi:hypothetical protein